MRNFILTVIFTIVANLCFAQENIIGSFILQNNTLIWQKVYTFPEADSSAVKAFFFQNSNFVQEGSILKSYPLLKDHTVAKYSQRPVYFNDPSRLKFIVQIKENRYRVTLQSLEPIDTFIKGNVERGVENAKYLSNFLQSYLKSNGDVKNSFYNSAAVLEEALSSLFDYKEATTVLLDDDF